MSIPMINAERCAACGECADICPVSAISIGDGRAAVDETLCVECGACVAACPEAAVFT